MTLESAHNRIWSTKLNKTFDATEFVQPFQKKSQWLHKDCRIQTSRVNEKLRFKITWQFVMRLFLFHLLGDVEVASVGWCQRKRFNLIYTVNDNFKWNESENLLFVFKQNTNQHDKTQIKMKNERILWLYEIVLEHLNTNAKPIEACERWNQIKTYTSVVVYKTFEVVSNGCLY